jgi:hypothetical protein
MNPDRNADTAPPRHGLLLTGSLGDVSMPRICANCGAAASESIAVENIFTGHSRNPNSHVVASIYVPFCPSCIARHRSEARVVTPLERFFLCFRTVVIIPALASGGFAAFFGLKVLKELATGDGQSAMMLSAVVAFFGLISAGTVRSAYNQTARFAVIPRTSVTSAFDYGADCSELSEPERHRYWIRNEAFAEAFAALNQNRVWHSRGPAARAAKSKRTAALVAFGVVIAVILLWDVVANFLDHL